MIKIENIQAEKGRLVKGYFKVGGFSDGSQLELLVMIASGEKDGATLWFNGCIHGEEYGGTVSIIQFMNSMDIKNLKGTIIGVLVANLLAFREWSRNTPLDEVNLNRVFPGNPSNSFTHQLAHTYMETVCEYADFLIDLHSGDIRAKVPFYSIFYDDRAKIGALSKQMCKNCGSPLIWGVKGEAGLGDQSLLRQFTEEYLLPQLNVGVERYMKMI